jgi:multicomponent Na+:H+ antiporter subunit B
MTSLILRTATRYLFIPLMIFSIYLFLRGHHSPGGGFVGGLMAGAAYALYALAFDVATARKKLRVDPISLAVMGLAMACFSGVPALFYGAPFLTGIWWEIPLLFGAVFDLGTPLLFDLGVYFVVWGILLTLVFSLGEEA